MLHLVALRLSLYLTVVRPYETKTMDTGDEGHARGDGDGQSGGNCRRALDRGTGVNICLARGTGAIHLLIVFTGAVSLGMPPLSTPLSSKFNSR